MQRETPDPDATETRTQVDRPPRRERRSPGTLLGRYVLLEELGRGGMSLVYVAYDPELDRRVALKVVRGEQLTEAHSARLHREAQALARLSHPNVVTVFDVGDVSGDTFVAMELLEGVSLRKWLLEARTWRDIVRVMVAAGRGLAAAHAAGILHRDIKPDNIVITATGAVKLVDFGLARDLGDRSASGSGSGGTPTPGDHDLDLDAPISTSESVTLRPLEAITQFGHVVGTPAYMPPEQRARRPDADQRADQFSFCATLYEALYGQRPFKVSKQELLDVGEQLTIVDKPGVEPRTLAAAPPRDVKVPAWVQRVVNRGLAVAPGHRYPSVDALLADLDRDPERTRRRVAIGAT
ncbi:MAG: serine/threonine protein kinase, partial [Myxococcales bacterium]|nr:serine/threonine protein kinase [Myxococcales bacterium]